MFNAKNFLRLVSFLKLKIIFVAFFYSYRICAADFLSPQHDIRFSLDFRLIEDAISSFNGASYRGHINLDDIWCGNPEIFLDIQNPALSGNGLINFSNGTYSFNMNSSVDVRVHVNKDAVEGSCKFDCTTQCNGHANIGKENYKREIPIKGECKLCGIFNNNFTIPLGIPIPLGFSNFTINLTPTSLGEPNKIDLEFGKFIGEQWVSAGKEKAIPVFSNVGGIRGSDGVSNLIIDCIIGEETKTVSFNDINAARADFEKDLPKWDDVKLGLSTSKTFYDELFKRLLPIKVWGKQQSKDLLVNFEIYLMDADIKFNEQNGVPIVEITLSSSNGKVWSSNENKIVLKNINAFIAMYTPSIEKNGDIIHKVKECTLKIDIETEESTETSTVTLTTDLEGALNNNKLNIGNIQPNILINLPFCINTGVKQITSDIVDCNNNSTGIMALVRSKDCYLNIDISKFKVRVRDDKYQIGFPVTIIQNP